MIRLLESDQRLRPELFVWNGPIPKERLEVWLRERKLQVPADLVSLWVEKGGGDLFESETILGPFGRADMGDDVDGVNRMFRSRGLDPSYLLIHVGVTLTAIRLRDQAWVTLQPTTYEETGEFDSMEEWYRSVLRIEFAQRYGLPPG